MVLKGKSTVNGDSQHQCLISGWNTCIFDGKYHGLHILKGGCMMGKDLCTNLSLYMWPPEYPNWFSRKIEEPPILMGFPPKFETVHNYAEVCRGSRGD